MTKPNRDTVYDVSTTRTFRSEDPTPRRETFDSNEVLGVGCVAAVRIVGGAVEEVRCDLFACETSHDAECRGISFAREQFPLVTIYNDNTSACDACGAIWIPREDNWLADEAAYAAYRLQYHANKPELRRAMREFIQRRHEARQKKQRRHTRKRRLGGRGVIAMGDSRYVTKRESLPLDTR